MTSTPLHATLTDIRGKQLGAGPTVPLNAGLDRHHICRFAAPPPPPTSDAPSYLLTLYWPPGTGRGKLEFWIAPSDPPVDGPQEAASGVPRAGQAGIDYSVRDFAGFSAMMRIRMAANLGDDAGWALSQAADPLTTVSEILAARGDYLSYRQDASGTEAYLTTARRRSSVTRHARLLDYPVNEGCAARTWLAFNLIADIFLPAGLLVVSPQPGTRGSALAAQPLAAGTIAFETMEPLYARRALSDLSRGLPPGQTIPAGTCTLALRLPTPALAAGRVLIFEQRVSPDSDPPFGSHAIRLLQATTTDEGTTIVWHPEDALPRPLAVPRILTAPGFPVLHGNVVLADHGITVDGVPLSPEAPPDTGDYRPSLPDGIDPIRAAPLPRPSPGWSPSDTPAVAAGLVPSARAALAPDPRIAVPQVILTDTVSRQQWYATRDLFRAPAQARLFVAEMADAEDGSGQELSLRFGDGVLGRRPPPGARFTARIRAALGQTGQVKPGGLTQIVGTNLPGNLIRGVTNPLPASPVAPETTAAVRLLAQQAFRIQQRGVSTDDWKMIAESHPLVTLAAAEPSTDQRQGCRVAIETVSTSYSSDEILDIVTRYLLGFAVIGAPPTVVAMETVQLHIAFSVYCNRDADIPSLRGRLAQRLGSGYLADGTRAFFHPSRLPPGRPIRLAEIVAAIRAEPGVRWVNVNPQTDPRLRFTRSGSGPGAMPAFFPGEIPIGRTERPRLRAGTATSRDGSLTLFVIAEP